jgi:hypothetical protein
MGIAAATLLKKLNWYLTNDEIKLPSYLSF